jgi:hypothetical protein
MLTFSQLSHQKQTHKGYLANLSRKIITNNQINKMNNMDLGYLEGADLETQVLVTELQ